MATGIPQGAEPQPNLHPAAFPTAVRWCRPANLSTADCGLICRGEDGCDYVIKDGVSGGSTPRVPHCEWFCSELSSQQAAERAKQNGVITGNLIHPQIICSLRLVDRHNGFFALLRTIAVACFTLALWQSTKRLWQLGERTAERQLRTYVLIESAAFVLNENDRAMLTRRSCKN